MAEYGLYKREWQKWLRARQKRAPFKPGETVTTLLKEFKASPSGVNIPATTAMQYFQDLFGKGALIPKYPELESLTVEYIKTKLKAGKTMDMIKNEWARENNLWDKISKGRSQTYKNPFDSMVQTKITNTIKANPELTQLLNIIKTNQDSDLNLKRYNKFIKDNIGKYKAADGTYKSGFRENLYNDALKFFKKNYPGSVQTAFGLRGGQLRIPSGAEFIRIKSGPGASATSYEHGKQRIRDVAEAKMPTSVGKKGRLHTFGRLKARDVTAAESLGMTEKAYRSAVSRNLLYPLGKLFPTLYRTPYAPSAEHAYPLQQAIATNMAGEIKAGSKGIYPSTKKMNIFIKGPRLDQKVTSQLRLAYEAADPKIKKRYLNTANELISTFKKEFPGKYPRYGLTGRNNIVNLNPPGAGLLKAPLSSKVTGYIDALIQTPGFLESPELKGLPSEAQTLIKSRSTPKYNTLLNNFIKEVKGAPTSCQAILRKQTGGIATTCVEAIKRDPVGSANKLANMEATSGALGKVKNAAKGFLGILGRGGVKAAPYAALAAAGAAAEPLVKQFHIDDRTTYLTDENQMKGMLLATLEGEPPKVDEEILKWQMPALGAATAAGAIPGAGEVFKGRLAEGVGKTRAALGIKGVLGKALGASFSPLAVAATTPISIAAQRAGGTDYGDIATDPMNWMGPAFASTGAEMATRGIKNPMLANAIRLGISPRTLSLVSRRFGLPGLAISAGMWGYDKWKNRSVNDED